MFRRKIRWLVFVSLSLNLVAGCNSDFSRGSDTREMPLAKSRFSEDQMNKNPNIIMKTGRSTYPVHTERITVTLVNRTGKTLSYGLSYQIEKYQEGTWFQIPFRDDVAFIEIARLLKPGQMAEEDISLSEKTLKYPLTRESTG
ncbi:immunoglobulin-like domain-containing protein [Sporolactobacillus sp. Y61]|uniref:Immunoglobulin-like domain-containing protein n=1 Tax=Sporolactobacillus sp. Y61 TaxID=3160863 RepID=A0AAU8IFA7_9BACL